MKSTVAKMGASFLAGALIVGGGAYAATQSNNQVNACINKSTRVMTLAPASGKCPSGTSSLSWNIEGPQGPQGPQGIQGIQGIQGPAGDKGAAGATGSASATSALAINVSALAEKLLPSVVSISVKTATGSGTGSGSIFQSGTSLSYVLTNNHVITGATKVTVELEDGSEVDGQVVGFDTAYDLAVVLIKQGNLPTVTFGDSSKMRIGEPVVAIGSPLGLSGTVTSGIISALHRPVTTGGTGSEAYIDALQTDTAINPGNSGGPLVNAASEVIGVNSAIATLSTTTSSGGSIGLGFSIPINQAKRIANEIINSATISNATVITKGTSTRPLLGVTFDTTYTGIGAKIGSVTSGGAADLAGISAGNIIKSVDGTLVKDNVETIVRIRSHAPGERAVLVVEVSGTNKTFNVTLGSAPSNNG